MGYSQEKLLTSMPNELDYLCRTYCKENSYITLNDLKHRHKEYIYEAIMLLRRFLETQLTNVNQAGIGVYTYSTQMLQQSLEYYRLIDGIDSVTGLKTACETYKAAYEEFVNQLINMRTNLPYNAMQNDIKSNIFSHNTWRNFAKDMREHIHIKGHHANILLPFPETDIDYTASRYSSFLEDLMAPSVRRFYSYYVIGLDESLFFEGKCLRTSRDRVNMRTKTFDAVVTTKASLFDGTRIQLAPATNYVKPEGSLFIVGLTTDFTKLDLRRIANALTDIHVYFYRSLPSVEPRDNEFCMVAGRVKIPGQDPVTYRQLLDIFVNQTQSESVFDIIGSDENTQVPFSSYDITQEDFLALVPTVRKTTNKLYSTLVPKTVQDTRQPLLPFSSGQLGLILISGEINGSIREDDTGCCHVVKGSSRQYSDTVSESTTNNNGEVTHIKRTTSVYSSTNVNIVLPTGGIRTLH